MTDTKMADDKKTLEQQNAQRQKDMEERNKTHGRPTPTQMENDLAAMGNHPELEPDGSPVEGAVKKELHAATSGSASYSTKQATAAPSTKTTEK
jgi:hypothetical protein